MGEGNFTILLEWRKWLSTVLQTFLTSDHKMQKRKSFVFPHSTEVTSLEGLMLWWPEVNQSKWPLAWWFTILIDCRQWPSTALKTCDNDNFYGRGAGVVVEVGKRETVNEAWRGVVSLRIFPKTSGNSGWVKGKNCS